MRARGTQVTDVAIIIIAADDAVMPTTRRLSHTLRQLTYLWYLPLTKSTSQVLTPTACVRNLLQ